MAAMEAAFQVCVPACAPHWRRDWPCIIRGMARARDMGCSPTLAPPALEALRVGVPIVRQPTRRLRSISHRRRKLQQRQVVALQQQGKAQFRAGKYTRRCGYTNSPSSFA